MVEYRLNQSTAQMAHDIWDYLVVQDPVERADCIKVLGCSRSEVAVRAAELYRAGVAPLVICTGGNSKKTDGWAITEARICQATLMDLGVDDNAIWTEVDAKSFGDNIKNVRQMCEDRQRVPKSVAGVCIDFGARRWKASMLQQWQGVEPQVVPAGIDFQAFCRSEETFSIFVRDLRNELTKVLDYPSRGFMVRQDSRDPRLKAARTADRYFAYSVDREGVLNVQDRLSGVGLNKSLSR